MTVTIFVGTIDCSDWVIEKVDIYNKATDGIGGFNARLKTEGSLLNDYLGTLPDGAVYIKYNATTLFTGYMDRALPYTDSKKALNEQYWDIAGRDYGQDLSNKLVDKVSSGFPYSSTVVAGIISDMLTSSSSELSCTGSLTDAITTTYKDDKEEHLIEAIRKIAEEENLDFYVDGGKVLRVFPIGSISSGVTFNTTNIIGELQITKFDLYELRNYIKITGQGVTDGWTDDTPEYIGFTGATGNTVTTETAIVSAGVSAIKSALGTNADDTCEIAVTFPAHNYTYLPFNELYDEELQFDLFYHSSIGTNYVFNPTLWMQLTDTSDNVIKYIGSTFESALTGWHGNWTVLDTNDAVGSDLWKTDAVPIGTSTSISTTADHDRWFYLTGSTFTWQVKKIDLYAKSSDLAYIVLDRLSIPIPMLAISEDATSQSLYKKREWHEYDGDKYTQRELDEYADSELSKKKDPVSAVKVKVKGSSGIVNDQWKLIPGYVVHVDNTLNAVDNDLRIVESHIGIDDNPIDGNDFYVDLTLVVPTTSVKGSRLANAEEEGEVELLRELWDRMRKTEKSVAGVASRTYSGMVGGGVSSHVNWSSVPYINVNGYADFYGTIQSAGSVPVQDYSSSIYPCLQGWDAGGTWTPDAYEMMLGVSKLRFTDNINNNYLDLGLIYSSQDTVSPMLWLSQHLVIKKDLGVGGMVTSYQGAVNLGHGLESVNDPPQIILFDSEGTLVVGGTVYSGTNWSTLQIQRANNNGLANLECNHLISSLVTSGEITCDTLTCATLVAGYTIAASIEADVIWCESLAVDDYCGLSAGASLALGGGTLYTNNIAPFSGTDIMLRNTIQTEVEITGSLDANNVTSHSIEASEKLLANTITPFSGSDVHINGTLMLGSDVQLWRVSDNYFYTPDLFQIANTLVATKVAIGDSDVQLYRGGADTLASDDVLKVAGLWNTGAITHFYNNGNLYIYPSGSNNSYLGINLDAQLWWGNRTGDWEFYLAREGVNTLRLYTADFHVANDVIVDGTVSCGSLDANTIGVDTITVGTGVSTGTMVVTSKLSVNTIAVGTGSTATITFDALAILPTASDVTNLGASGNYWGTIYTNVLNYKTHSTFDAYDDLALIKDGSYDNLVKSDGFYDIGKMDGFLLGCVKALAKENDYLKNQIEELNTKLSKVIK